ncbi:hypothetical protein AAC387_Pa04g1876 [Persea americana]
MEEQIALLCILDCRLEPTSIESGWIPMEPDPDWVKKKFRLLLLGDSQIGDPLTSLIFIRYLNDPSLDIYPGLDLPLTLNPSGRVFNQTIDTYTGTKVQHKRP